ncbi:MAG: class I SAM-dependent methyltransferase [Magnetococcales bacterium]|nr:class I SAM-dependent methyltransferase [Magnetococcales bacterium]
MSTQSPSNNGHKSSPPICHLCKNHPLISAPNYARLHRVTSDSQPFAPGGLIYLCPVCGTIQKHTDAHWREEVQQVYDAYRIYAQTNGGDHAVFDARGQAGHRSEMLLHTFLQHTQTPDMGKLLDIGCGNGNLLARFSRARPGWKLYGTEWNDRHRQTIEAIPGVEGFFSGDPSQAPGPFDLITLVYVLEHIPDPITFLRRLLLKLAPGGCLFVHVPDVERNPFDLVCIDHCTHFTTGSLGRVVEQGGFDTLHQTGTWVARELSVVAQRAAASRPHLPPDPMPSRMLERQKHLLDGHVAWLTNIAHTFQQAKGNPLGLFGTSIAATWSFQEKGGSVDFFVDEDRHQFGRSHQGRPILSPTQVPDGATLLMPFSPAKAQEIIQRLARPRLRYIVPPEMEP